MVNILPLDALEKRLIIYYLIVRKLIIRRYQVINLLKASKRTEESSETSSPPSLPTTKATTSTTRTTTEQGLDDDDEADINGHSRPSKEVDNALEERVSEFVRKDLKYSSSDEMRSKHKKEDNSGVYVVHAVPHVTKEEPLVQGERQGNDEEEYSARHSPIDENALQESRCIKSDYSMWRPLRLIFLPMA